MNNAQLQAIRDLAKLSDPIHALRNVVTITRTAEGFEVRKGGKLLGVTQTLEGANELAR